MASKIEDKSMQVAIRPYEQDGQTFDMVDVSAGYRKGRGFYVNIHPGWATDWGGFGCLFDFSKDPLTATTWVDVIPATKNSQKTIDQMAANLKQPTAQKIIVALFDGRKWETLKQALKHIATNAQWATPELLQSLTKGETINNSNNNQNSEEDTTMRLNINNQNETKNAAQQQVNNDKSEAIVKQVDVMGLMNGLKKNGTAKLSDYATPIEDAQAEEIESVSVGEVTVDSIMPKMTAEPMAPTKQEVATAISKAANEGKATTMPLGSHGTLVIAGVGSDKPTTEKPKPAMPKRDASGKFLKKSEVGGQKSEAQTETKVQDSVPQPEAGGYRLVLVPGKEGGQWPKLYGFQTEQDADKMLKKLAKSIRRSWDRDEQGEKRFYIYGGKKYCDVFQELCRALNSGDAAAIGNACRRSVEVYNGAVADGKAETAAKRAEREAAKATQEQPATPAMSDEERKMFDLFKRFMQGDKEVMAMVNAKAA